MLCSSMHWECPLGVPIFGSPYRISNSLADGADAIFDVLTSHPYSGERAICSSDFSAFKKWPYLFFAELFHLHFGDCNSRRCSPNGGVHWFSLLPAAMFSLHRERRPARRRVNFMFGLFYTCAMQFTMLKCITVQVVCLSPSRSGSGLDPSWLHGLGFGCWARGEGVWADGPHPFSPFLARASMCGFAGLLMIVML